MQAALYLGHGDLGREMIAFFRSNGRYPLTGPADNGLILRISGERIVTLGHGGPR